MNFVWDGEQMVHVAKMKWGRARWNEYPDCCQVRLCPQLGLIFRVSNALRAPTCGFDRVRRECDASDQITLTINSLVSGTRRKHYQRDALESGKASCDANYQDLLLIKLRANTKQLTFASDHQDFKHFRFRELFFRRKLTSVASRLCYHSRWLTDIS